jgi:hypothetical protein
VVPVPAGMTASVKLVVPETTEVSGPITYDAVAGWLAVPWPGTVTVPRTFAVTVAPVTRGVEEARVETRCTRFSEADSGGENQKKKNLQINLKTYFQNYVQDKFYGILCQKKKFYGILKFNKN